MGDNLFMSSLPLWVVMVPFVTMLLLILCSRLKWLRSTVSILGTGATLAAVLYMWPVLARGEIIFFKLPFKISPLDLTFRVDGLGFMVAAVSSFVWLAATIYAISYMDHEKNQGRFFVFLSLTFMGTLGVPLAGDFLTLLVFFEIMSIASYVLVVHTQTDEAMGAGLLYLFMGLFGGMCLLVGMGAIYRVLGSIDIAPGIIAFEQLSGLYYLAIVLMITGFGIKAGMAPLHIWLPRAHPVAPAPASALLSGIMIKTGAYGILRTVNMLFTPQGDRSKVVELAEHFSQVWASLSNLGYAIIWIGIVTMLFGALMAILQDNIKKMLACSSISQMGYILMGIGVGAYLGYDGAMGIAGTSFHILNHALFKSALFLVAGVIAFKFGELNMYELGGLARRMPFTAGVGLIASLGILGIPLFNGYASKTLLHHAVVKAYHHQDLFSLRASEWLFTIASACTVCYFIKFLYLTFFRSPVRDYGNMGSEPLAMKFSMGLLGAAMLAVGFFPHVILDRFVLPVLDSFMLSTYNINKYLVGLNFWALEDFLAVLIAVIMGAFFFWIGMRTGAFRSSVPAWLSQEYAGTLMGRGTVAVWNYLSGIVVLVLGIFRSFFACVFRNAFGFLQRLDYRPGRSSLYRTVNIGNIDFDVMMIIIILGGVLAFLFFLQFGLTTITG